jgi:hypothetical protein
VGTSADGSKREAQAELDGCALFIDACNRALLKLDHLRRIAELSDEEIQSLSVYGIGSRDEHVRELREIQDECLMWQTSLFLRTPVTFAEEAAAVRPAFERAASGWIAWNAARARRAEDEQEWRREALARLATHAQLFTTFSIDAQKRYSSNQSTDT